MTRCDFRTYGECPCPAGTCQQEPEMSLPLHQPSIVVTLSTAVIIGSIAAFISFVSIPRAIEANHQQQLENQEQITWQK